MTVKEMKEILSVSINFVEIEEVWNTLLIRNKEKICQFVDKIEECCKINEDDNKNLTNSVQLLGKRFCDVVSFPV